MKNAVSRLASVAARYPTESAPRFAAPCRAAELLDLQGATGLPLPAEVRSLLSTHSSIVAIDIHKGYWIGGPTNLARSVRRGDYPTFVEAETGRVRAQPVATDGGGNAFLITETGDVWRWDHETGGTWHVAESFEAFLNRIADDWEHYLAEDRGWVYLV